MSKRKPATTSKYRASANVDWAEIRRRYRTGTTTIRELAREYQVSDTAIRKKRDAEAWERDLTPEVRVVAAVKVREAEVRNQVREPYGASEQGQIESDALLLAAAEVQQRANCRAARELVTRLLAELTTYQANPEALEILPQLVDWQAADLTLTQKVQLLTTLKAACSLGDRVDVFKKLVEALRYVVELERKVLRMDADDKTSMYAELLRMAEEAGRV